MSDEKVNENASAQPQEEQSQEVAETEKSSGERKVEETVEAPSLASPALLEALLLAHGDPISFVRLQEIMKCNRSEVMQAVEKLRDRYASVDSGVEVIFVAEKLQLRTKALYAEQVRELMSVKPKKLSQAALETLAVIAYQQPVVKSEIDKIRGVDVAPTIKTLVERKLIKILGYQPTVGQPALYGTTEEFLRIFGLRGLSDLPALRDLKMIAKDPGEAGNDDAVDEDDSTEETSAEEVSQVAEQEAAVAEEPMQEESEQKEAAAAS